MAKIDVEVALCDDEVPEQNRLKGILDTIFDQIGFTARVTSYNSLDDLRIALRTRPHYVFVDNVFSGEANAGIQFISAEKDNFPDIIFTLMTGATFSVDQLGFRLPNPDFIVTKSHVVEVRYQAYISQELRKMSKRYPMQGVYVDGIEASAVLEKMSGRELLSLVEQVVYESGLVNESDSLQAQLRPLTGGYSGAAVFEMNLSGSSRSVKVPAAVKLAPRGWIESEVDAFSSYVKWQLPHTLRVDVVGVGRTDKWGAVAYAFVLAGEGRTLTATDLLRKGSSKAVDRVLSDLLKSRSTAWYKALSSKGGELSERLANSDEFDSRKDTRRDKAFKTALEAISKAEQIAFFESETGAQLDDIEFPRARRAVFQKVWGPIDECYCHGDLNSNNVIMDPRASKMALIDFGDSGRKQVYRDFISFENSIRLEWPGSIDEDNMSIRELVSYESSALNGSYDKCPAYLDQVRKVRSIAFESFPNVERKHYSICLALNVWKVIAVKEWPLRAKMRMLAVYQACVANL